MSKKLRDDNLDFLFEAVLQLESVEECANFLEDLCTIQELKSISQRLNVAKLLSANHNYNYIVDKTGASTATISRVNRSLNYGKDGYKVVFERLRENGLLELEEHD
ncbi:MAG: YerC/YecD family TrpR-related protein [Oscillospiraceae bacterium]|nr:YerC/YecD family TrpR-related protein [Oscillospiraceae bacterium]